jgi:hypothetical protein
MLKMEIGFLESTEAQLDALGTALLFNRFDPEFKSQILALRISEVWALLRGVAFPECRRPSGNVVYRPSAGIRQFDIICAAGARHRSIIVWKA